MRQLFSNFMRDETGATAIEYGLIASGLTVAMLATYAATGQKMRDLMTYIGDSVIAAMT